MALSTQLRQAPYQIPPPRINPMSATSSYPAPHFSYPIASSPQNRSTTNLPMFSNLHSSTRNLSTSAVPSGFCPSSLSSLLMCQQTSGSPPPPPPPTLSNDLPTPDSGSCNHPGSPLPPRSPEVEDQELSSYDHLKSCAYSTPECSFSETGYTPSISSNNGYSSAFQNSIMNSIPPLSTTSNSIYPFATPMYSSTVDYSSSYSSGSASNIWNPYPSLPTMAGPMPIANSSSTMPNYKLSYDSPRYKLTPERAIPLVKWFEEHKEHPYPTRHEKILLCQSTQLTFTQVSTWFANARRRMKKANSEEEESRNNSDDCASQSSAESSPRNNYEETISPA